MKKTSLIVISALLFAGCSSVDDLINETVNDTVSGDVTTATIQAKDKVLIINHVSLSACAVIKNGLIDDDELYNVETLVTEVGVHCSTYGKTEGLAEDSDTACIEQSLIDWLEEEDHYKIIELEKAEGDKACVIGSDV